MEFSKNIGEYDRKIRLVAGVVIAFWGVYAQSWLGLIGVVLLVTAFLRTCPAYSVLKMDTLEKK
ncbi:MAG: DUF2892 domain-containing protein [Thiocapsa sp.]|jgi:hypothetical protein|nr:DUF2892 domain-containing protein [Thiocapsa sp.]MCG6897982.1 DUF2892 domain-containing protein [Thiocapsa sp.]MCG6983741.1 DUF2892 domain-containing protein [Thiocapsa sp.]